MTTIETVMWKTTMKKQDNVWISFIEGLHQHAAIVMCLTCSVFDFKDNFIEKGSLKRKDFRVAGVQHYKRPNMSTMQVLNEILNNHFEATMLMTPFTVQVLIPRHNTS
jgi:hypothetical protein